VTFFNLMQATAIILVVVIFSLVWKLSGPDEARAVMVGFLAAWVPLMFGTVFEWNRKEE
jgi:hypothetical protein